jgi:hypothetical protein
MQYIAERQLRPLGEADVLQLRLDCSSAAVPPRRKTTSMQHIEALCRDSNAFFSVLPADIVQTLHAFLWRRRPNVGDPRRLQRVASVPAYFPYNALLLCTDALCNFVVFDYAIGGVSVYNSTGAIVTVLGSKQGVNCVPDACVMGADGSFYATEKLLHCVRVFRSDGRAERDIGAGILLRPHGLDLSKDDALLYVASTGNGLVCVFDCATDTLVRTYYMEQPYGVAMLSDSRVAVSGVKHAAHESYLCVLHLDGTLAWTIGSQDMHGALTRLAVDGADNLYGVCCITGTVWVYSVSGAALTCITNDNAPYTHNSVAFRNDGSMAACHRNGIWLYRTDWVVTYTEIKFE